MALNFPDNPSDGDEYSASNGVVYTYNASTDTWTGSSAAGDNYWSETADGSGIYVTDTSSKVGIGTDNPTVELDVKGTIMAGGDANNGNAVGCRVNSVGIYQATRNGDQPVFIGYDGTTKDANVSLSATGDAYFAALLTAGSFNIAALSPLPDVS